MPRQNARQTRSHAATRAVPAMPKHAQPRAGGARRAGSGTYYLRTSGVHFDGIADLPVPHSPSVKPPGASPCYPRISTQNPPS